MKKSILTLYIFFLAPIIVLAQPDWQWGQEVRFNSQDIAVDNQGNSYVTWSLQDPYEIDGELFISNGSSDAALTSFDCDGVHRWTKIIGGSGGDRVSGLGADTLGGIYLIYNINSSKLENYNINIDNDTTLISQRKGMLLVKYNTDGEFQWSHMPEDSVVFDITTLHFAGTLGMDVAPNGDCYIYSKLPIGSYSNGAFEATYPGTAQDGENMYALKYDSEGNCTGADHFDFYYSLGGSLGTFTRNHHTGKYYMSGYLQSDNNIIIFGGEEVTANNYVVQFDSEGNVNWTLTSNDSNTSTTRLLGKPSVDELGNVYVTGNSYNGNSFGDFTFENSYGIWGFAIFVKIDSIGNVVYASNASATSGTSGTATAFSNNQVGVTGRWGSLLSWGDILIDSTSNDSQGANVFLTFFDPEGDGTPESFHSLTSSPLGAEFSSLLVADRENNFYIGGNFSGQLMVGDGTLYNQTGSQEGFIAKFGSDSCYCPLPEMVFTYDSIPNQAEYAFVYTGSTDVDSVVWDFGDGNVGYGTSLQHLFAETGSYTVCATAYNSCGPDSVCITIDALGPVGVKPINGFENIKLYPNPAKEVVTIGNATPGTRAVVINAMGQQLQSAVLLSSPFQIDISKLPPGVYLLQLTDGNESTGYARFVKE